MELRDAMRQRRMVRSFDGNPIDDELLGTLLDDSLRAPSAGNTQGTSWLVLAGPEQTATYWDHATTPDWRERSSRWPGLSRAPVVSLSLASRQAYVDRYGEPDKAASGLGDQPHLDAGTGAAAGGGGHHAGDPWPIPYWFGDAAFATMSLLLLATEAGLGGCFLGNFRGEVTLLPALGVPDGWRLFGAVLLGYPDGADHRSASLDRPGPGREARVHRGRWRVP